MKIPSWLHASCVSAAIAVIAPMAAMHADAAAPLLKTQAPGYYRMMVGDFEVTALLDGTSPMPAAMIDEPEEKTKRLMNNVYVEPPAETSTNAYLVNTGSKLILVDTGAGTLLAPTLGQLLVNLKAAGYEPGQVDEVYLTHLHPDHIGGLMAGDKPAFPNATIYADKRDPELWLNQKRMDAAPSEGMNGQRRFRFAMTSLNAYVEAGKLKTFDGATRLAPGIEAIPAPGHTPGHTMYAFESKGQKILLSGDLVVSAPIQFAEPDVTTRFDSDGKLAAAQRNKVYVDAASKRYWLAGAHLSFPGIGHLRKEGEHYIFIPATYTALH